MDAGLDRMGIRTPQETQENNGNGRTGRAVIDVDESSFDDAVRSSRVAIVDIWAAWCGPCKAFGPVFEKVAAENAGKAAFLKMDIDHNQVIGMRYTVQSIPTLLVFHDGEIVHRQAGALPEDAFRQLVAHVTH